MTITWGGRELFAFDEWTVKEITPAQSPELQRFFAANPDYFHIAYNQPPGEDAAWQELHEAPLADLTYDQKWVLGLYDATPILQGVATVWRNFLADRVWLISFFMVATDLQGRGIANRFYLSIEQWMKAQHAAWIRLGVIANHRQAERFWTKQHYTEVRKRIDPTHCPSSQTVRVMVKPLTDQQVSEYLTLVKRDRP